MPYRYVGGQGPDPTRAHGSTRRCRRSPTGGPDAVRVEALAASPRGLQGRLLLALQGSPGAARGDARHLGEGRVEDVIARVESRAGRPAGQAAAALRARPVGRLRGRAGAPGLVAPRRDVAKRLRRVDNRRMEYLRSLFAQFCAGRGRRRGPQHAGLLAADRQLLRRGASTVTGPGPRCCSSRSTGCSASRGTDWPR